MNFSSSLCLNRSEKVIQVLNMLKEYPTIFFKSSSATGKTGLCELVERAFVEANSHVQVFQFNCLDWEEGGAKPKTFIYDKIKKLLDLYGENFNGTVPSLMIMNDFHEMYSAKNFSQYFFKVFADQDIPLLKIICLSTYGAVSQPYSPFAPYFSNLTLGYKDFLLTKAERKVLNRKCEAALIACNPFFKDSGVYEMIELLCGCHLGAIFLLVKSFLDRFRRFEDENLMKSCVDLLGNADFLTQTLVHLHPTFSREYISKETKILRHLISNDTAK